jgi:hypothetical protein
MARAGLAAGAGSAFFAEPPPLLGSITVPAPLTAEQSFVSAFFNAFPACSSAIAGEVDYTDTWQSEWKLIDYTNLNLT